MNDHEADIVASVFREIVSGLLYYNLEARQSEIEKYSAPHLRAYVAEDPGSVLVARLDGAIVGICISRFDDSLIWLSWFLVDSRYRGRGIGASLIATLEESVRGRGIHKIWCDCRTENRESKTVLTRSGFLPLCTVRNHWYRQDFILWEKSLA
jgi:RimJ/RimL family protein N-acetyltransferase